MPRKGRMEKGKAVKGGDVDPKSFEYDKDYYKDKECFRCGKKGHPKAACTVKLASDDKKSREKGADKTAKLSESRSKGSGSSSDMRNMIGAMNKSIKTFGKAMSQVSEEFEHLGNDNSIGAQSHAQVGRIGLEDRGYAFAA